MDLFLFPSPFLAPFPCFEQSLTDVQKKARRLFLAFRTSNSLDIVLCSLLALSLTIVAEQRGEKIRKSRVTGRVILPDPNRKIAGQERSTKLADEMSGDSNNRHFYFLFYLQFFHFSRLFTLLHDRDICKKKKRKKKERDVLSRSDSRFIDEIEDTIRYKIFVGNIFSIKIVLRSTV